MDEEKKKSEITIDTIDIDIDPNDFEFGGRDSIKVVKQKDKVLEEVMPNMGDRSSDV